jgi:hypothetical protein
VDAVLFFFLRFFLNSCKDNAKSLSGGRKVETRENGLLLLGSERFSSYLVVKKQGR